MCMSVCVCVCMSVRVRVYECARVRAYECVRVRMSVRECVCMSECECMSVRVRMYECACACMSERVCVSNPDTCCRKIFPSPAEGRAAGLELPRPVTAVRKKLSTKQLNKAPVWGAPPAPR